MCCICIDGSPIEDSNGRIKVYLEGHEFRTPMLTAPVKSVSSFCCFMGQMIPCSMGITQYILRRKALNGDMTKYACGQGYFDCLCFKAGNCCERQCPDLCLFLEGCCINCVAVSATRMYISDEYNLRSDPCDYRLIRINNCLQLASCICNVLAIFIAEIRECSRLLDCIANIFYHCTSGCMSAQVNFEIDERLKDIPQTEAIVIGEGGIYNAPSAPIKYTL